MDRLVVRRERRLLDRFAKRRVPVARPRDVLARRAVLHRQHALGDQLPGVGAHDVGPQDLVGVGVRNKLDDALGVVRGARAAVGHEGELACLVRGARGLDLLLGLADGGGLGPGVDDGGDGGVVDVAGFALKIFFFFFE